MEVKNESIQDEATEGEVRSREATEMGTSTPTDQHSVPPVNRAILELQTARALTNDWKLRSRDPFFCLFECRLCNKELGIDELEADFHFIEHFADTDIMKSNQLYKEVFGFNYLVSY